MRAAAAMALTLAGAAVAAGCLSESHKQDPQPLRVVATPLPRFVASFYDSGGTFPQVRAPGEHLAAVNAGIRRAIAADQRRYVSGFDDWIHGGSCGGIYVASIDPHLVSASSVVVSAMLPALELHPCGNDGAGWVSFTVRVPSGRAVRLSDLFAQPKRGLRALAAAWREQFRRQKDGRVLLRFDPRYFRAGRFAGASYALTPHGLAVGFWQYGPTNRLHAVVPYSALRPHLGALGARLIAGVREPKFKGGDVRHDFQRPPITIPTRIRTAFSGTGEGTPTCELVEGVAHQRPRVRCVLREIAVEVTRTRVSVCHGMRCARGVPHAARMLDYGEWIASRSLSCVSMRAGIRCRAEVGPRRLLPGPGGFLLGHRGLWICRDHDLLCARRRDVASAAAPDTGPTRAP